MNEKNERALKGVGEPGTKMSKTTRLILISLGLMLFSSIGASLLQSNFGRVRIQDIYIPTDHQGNLHAVMFIPKEASAENKLPVVITCHGSNNSNEMQDAAEIELSRRGFVVIGMDGYSHGLSSNVWHPETRNAQQAVDALGMIPLVEFVSKNIDYVDTTRLAVMGHSMGGRNAWQTAQYYGRLYEEALSAAEASDSDGGTVVTQAEREYAEKQNKIFSAFVEGVPTYGAGFKYIHTNMGFIYGAYEESGYRNKTGSPVMGGTVPESLDMVNSGMPEDQKLSSIELGKFYGNTETRSLRVVYNPPVTHPWIHFSSRATANFIEYYINAYKLDTTLSPKNQIWNIKELFNLIGLVGLFLLVVPMANALLGTCLFAELKKPVPEALPALGTPLQKRLFWGGWILSNVLSIIFAALMAPVYPHLSPRGDTAATGHIFGQYPTNYILLWAMCNAAWGFISFLFIYYKFSKKNGVTSDMLGLKVSAREFFKTLLLAVTMMGIIYALVAFSRWLFFTDYRIWLTAFKTFKPFKFKMLASYMPFFFLYFLINTVIINGQMRVKGMGERFNMTVCAFGNVMGTVVLFILQYGKLMLTRIPMWGDEWIPFLNLLLVIPQVFVAGYFARYLFKATGKIWLGALFNTFFVVMLGNINNIDLTIIG